MWWVALMAPAVWTGAESCRPCHKAIVESQSRHSHASALSKVAEHPLAPKFRTNEVLARGAYRFSVQDGVARTWDRQDSIELPLEWAFGAGHQAVTFVTRVDAQWHVEHALSYFSSLKGFGPTPGHADRAPRDLKEAAGVLYKSADPEHGIAGCFECHTTGPFRFDETGAATFSEPGVRCEACHGAAGGHVASRGKLGPGKLNATKVNDLCGRCHRPPAVDAAKIDWTYAWNVRHQPVYFSQSTCFRKSGGRLSCLGCHSPHDGLETSADFYNAKCGACHAKPAAACRANCVDCHMPRVSPQTGLRFTNHWIGVYQAGSRLKPRR